MFFQTIGTFCLSAYKSLFELDSTPKCASFEWYHLVLYLIMPLNLNLRAFKTAQFSKDAKKTKIKDDELCLAIEQVLLGQVDDLGGGVFKNDSITTYTGPSFWPKAASIGFSNTCLPNRIVQTSKKMNYLRFACWPTVMRV